MDKDVKRMAELLKSGAVMLSETCPICGSPLFKMRDEVYCVQCDKKVVLVRGPTEEFEASSKGVLLKLEESIFKKVQDVEDALNRVEDPNRMLELGRLLSIWLDILEKVRRLRIGHGREG